jgi:competence protein ComEC
VPALAGLGVRRLDAVVLTHPDRDHCGGLLDLTAYLPVGELWTAVGWRRDGCIRELLLAPGVALRPLWAGERARLGAWRLTVLHPSPGERGGGNERSVVLRAETGRHRVLLTGDLGAPGEARLLARHPGEELAADVLKVGHHGSRGATSGAFLDAVKPRLALISAGPGNLYGHPSPVVLDRLARRGVRALSTDRAGMIRVELRPAGSLRVHLPGSPR